jgi:hypothetical protein
MVPVPSTRDHRARWRWPAALGDLKPDCELFRREKLEEAAR